MSDLLKQRPNTRYSISFMEEDAFTEDKVPIKTIYVGNLSSEITKKEVKECFLKFGSVASVAIKRAGSKHAPWFYAFVQFEKTESATKALRQAKHEILNRRVVVKAAERRIQPKDKCMSSEVSRDEASEMEFSLLYLNDDCLYHIGSYLEPRDLLSLSKTCKRLECCLEPMFASYKKLYIDSLHYWPLATLHEILYKIGPHLRHIVCGEDFDLNGSRFEELLQTYCVTANIVSFDCRRAYALSKKLIQTFENLKTLKCLITDDMSAVLSNCKNLQNLDLYRSTNFTGKHLCKISNLQNLNLDHCSNLRPELFKNLCMKTRLVSLNIVGCKLLNYSSIETLSTTQTKLEDLSISNNYKTSNLLPLAALENLKVLRIDCFNRKCDKFFQDLAKHRGAELEVLEISNCMFNQKIEQAIYSLTKIKALAVYSCSKITSVFLTELALTCLECLVIYPLMDIVEQGILNLITKSETIKVIAADAYSLADKRPLVLSAYEIIKNMERKHPLSLFTTGPCLIDGILHEEPEFEPRGQFREIIRKYYSYILFARPLI